MRGSAGAVDREPITTVIHPPRVSYPLLIRVEFCTMPTKHISSSVDLIKDDKISISCAPDKSAFHNCFKDIEIKST